MNQSKSLQEHAVWDRSVRWFHWINVLSVLTLIAMGVVIMNSKALGVTDDGKILLKTWHVYVGYVFAINLGWRLVWGFIGNRYSRWGAILPLGKGYKQQRQAFVQGLKNGDSVSFKGHNPLARWMVTTLFVMMTVMAVTGLVLAGTDVYKPPFGSSFKAWIAESPATIDQIKPYSDVGVNEAAKKEMRDFRGPFKETHEIGFFILLALIVLHIAGVVVTELRERNGLVSAMFTGKKVFRETPIDHDDKA
jgi:cytochrome b